MAFTHCILAGGSGGTCFYSALLCASPRCWLCWGGTPWLHRCLWHFEKEASALRGLLLLLHREGEDVATTCKVEVALNRACPWLILNLLLATADPEQEKSHPTSFRSLKRYPFLIALNLLFLFSSSYSFFGSKFSVPSSFPSAVDRWEFSQADLAISFPPLGWLSSHFASRQAWGHHQYTWPMALAQQPKMTLSLVAVHYLPGRKGAIISPPASLWLHLCLNHAMVVSHHTDAGVQQFGSSCYLTKSSAPPFWGLAWALEALSWSTSVCCGRGCSCS